VPFFVKPVARLIANKVDAAFVDPQSKLHFDYIESELGQSTWLCGEDLSAADIMMSFPLEAAGTRFDLLGYPNIQAFVKRCHERPAYQRALERGGPYAYA
jgi:glutathione S-transferase